MKIKNNLSIDDHIYVFISLSIVFSLVDKYISFNIIVLTLASIYLIIKRRMNLVFPRIMWGLFGIVFLILIHILLSPSIYFQTQYAFKEISRIIMYSMIVLIISNIQISHNLFKRTWEFIFILVFLISVAQLFKLFGVNQILAEIYGETIHLRASSIYTSLKQFRAGSVFLNFNNYAKFILGYLSIFLCIGTINNRGRSILILFITIALILAGSRTGLIITMCLLLYRLILLFKKKNLSVNLIIGFYVIAIIGFVFTLINQFLGLVDFDILRLIKVGEGLGGSIEYKINTFLSFVSHFEALNVFVGMGNFNTQVWGETALDFDIGYWFGYYGIMGIVLYTYILNSIYGYRSYINSPLRELNKYFIIIIVLFGLTGGMFYNLRIFSIFLILGFTNISPAREYT